MISGKLDVISGLGFMQKVMMAFIPILPKRMMLKQIKKMQTKK